MNKVTKIMNGHFFNAEEKALTKGPLYIRDGLIISTGEITAKDEIVTWDAQGKYVSPGFIDMHVHVFENHAQIGMHADQVGVEQGVTTVVDAGSSGWRDFPTFKKDIINKNTTEILAFLNISSSGLVDGLDELSAENKLMSMEEWQKVHKSESSIVGLKARMSQSVVGGEGIKPLIHARKLADETSVPIMVHIGSPPPKLSEVFPLLKNGDIVTHAFHGKKGGVLDDTGHLIPEAIAALERGVKFDVGHGTSSFSFETLKTFKEKYNHPFTISTDVYEKNFKQPVGSLMSTMNKLLTLGYHLTDVLHAVTLLPAQNLSLTGYGTLNSGNKADITVFEMIDEQETLIDSSGTKMVSQKKLIPYAIWKNGQLIYKRG